jgi:Acetylaranotin biosynthesis cluster protein L
MTIIYAAATALVNPVGASPVLTLKQLWAGLELKARYVLLNCIPLQITSI